MADLGKSLKTAWMKGMEAIGNTASNIASNTKYKVQEMNLINRRREILSDFGAQAYEMWQKGETFPEKLEEQLRELSRVDEELNVIRTERLAGVKTEEEAAEAAPDEAVEEAAETPDEAAETDVPVPTMDVPEQAAPETAADQAKSEPVPTLEDVFPEESGDQ